MKKIPDIPKKTAILILLICIIIALMSKPVYQKLNVSEEDNRSTLCWSISDCNGIKTIQGIQSFYATGKYSTQSILSGDSLNNSDHFGLSYPFIKDNITYYTTTNRKTAEEGIVAKVENDYERFVSNDPQTDIEYQYNIKNNQWNILLSKYGYITYKNIVDDNIYYMINYGKSANYSEIWCYNMEQKTDKLVIPKAAVGRSFDVDEAGNILYINIDSMITLRDSNGNEKALEKGMTACFYDDSNIIKVTMSEVSIFDLTNQKERKLCSATGYAIVLSPSKNYIALCGNDYYKNSLYDCLTVIDLATGRINEIEQIPNNIYGISWG